MMSTPFKRTGGRRDHSNCSGNTNRGVLMDEVEINSDHGGPGATVDTPMDESSVLSSPPRSATRNSNRLSLFFDEECKSEVVGAAPAKHLKEKSDSQAHSPFVLRRNRTPIKATALNNFNEIINNGAVIDLSTKNNRRLFPEENEEDTISSGSKNSEKENLQNKLQLPIKKAISNRTPPFVGRNNPSATIAASLSMDDADNTSSSVTTAATTSRKRSSAERRGGGGMIATGGGGAACYLSPRISPNSFLTMDGRFVHSKNPFSSPMMTDDHKSIGAASSSWDLPEFDDDDDDMLTNNPPALAMHPSNQCTSPTSKKEAKGLTAPNPFSLCSSPANIANGKGRSTASPVKTFPRFMPDDCDENNHNDKMIDASNSIFKPSNNAKGKCSGLGFPALSPRARLAPPALGFYNNQHPNIGGSEVGRFSGGYRSSFTGSPIPEHKQSRMSSASAGKLSAGSHGGGSREDDDNSTSSAMMDMETDTASCGSLQKVRRLNLHDDVVSASGHALRNRVDELRIDTASLASPPWMMTYNKNGNRRPEQRQDSHSSCGGDSSTVSSMDGSHSIYYNRGSGFGNEDEISPTDIWSFPYPSSPTGQKSPTTKEGRHPQKQTPLARNGNNSRNATEAAAYSFRSSTKPRTLVPPTPVAERRRMATLAARTPHPGSLLHHHQHPNNQGGNVGHDLLVAGSVSKEKSRFYGDFDIISELGHGCFGTVYKVLSRLDGCMYAIKEAKRQAKGPTDRDRMLKEVYALAALSDQAHTATFHIVRYHQAWMEEDRLYIQTELCQGSVAGEMAKSGLTLKRRYKLLREICLALEFLHQNNMVHLDIKPDNIFVKNDQFKLGDFGLVSKISISLESNDEVEEGDSRYMSKELLGGDYTDLTKSDIFSLGATVYEISLGRPLPLNGEEWQNIRSGCLTPLPEHEDPELMSIIEHMMHPSAVLRPAATDLLKRSQLLSDEQKALMAERNKVAEANRALQQFQQQKPPYLHMPMRKGLQRANTWNGHSLIN